MQRKFGREYKSTDGLYELFGKFQVESYLEYNGYNFTKWFDPLTYLYITKAINIFDLSRGFDSLQEALKKVQSELYLISFSNDLLFRNYEMKELDIQLEEIGNKHHTYIDIQSDYGHDAFLVELEKFDYYIKEALNG
jgi:homoserine O-acetyltransferase